jgi:hypothetical protein
MAAVLHSIRCWWVVMTYLRRHVLIIRKKNNTAFVVSGLRTGASGFLTQARIRVFLFSKTFWSPVRFNPQFFFLFLGVKWVLREYSSHIYGSRGTIHTWKAGTGSGGTSPLYPDFSWWPAEQFKMFRTSEKYFATTRIRSLNLSDRSLVIILIKQLRIADQQISKQTFNQVRRPAPRASLCLSAF